MRRWGGGRVLSSSLFRPKVYHKVIAILKPFYMEDKKVQVCVCYNICCGGDYDDPNFVSLSQADIKEVQRDRSSIIVSSNF